MNWKHALSFVTVLAVPPSFLLAEQNGFSVIERSKAAGTAIAAALKDPLAVLDQRSPGPRGEAKLSKTKKERVLASTRERESGAKIASGPVVPRERVLANMRERPQILPLADASQLPEFSPVLDDPIPTLAPQSFTPTPTTPPPPFFPPFIPTGPGGSSGPTPPPPTPPVSAVPEPTTWITMILGFFAIGATIRHSRRNQAKPTKKTFFLRDIS